MKKLAFWIVVLVLVIAGIFGYSRFMHGNLKIDRELVSDENLNLLADNWEKLAESQTLLTGNEAAIYEDGTVGWSAIVNDKAIAFFTVWPDTASDTSVEIEAYYDRSGLKESTNHIYVCNSRYEIIYTEYEAEANAVNFENWFRELLQTAQS